MSTDESSPLSQPSTNDMPLSKFGWSKGLKVTAGVVVGALMVSGLGLFVSSRVETTTASAVPVDINSDFQLIQPFTSGWALSSIGSGLISASVGGVLSPFISMGMQELMKKMGLPSKEDQTLVRLNEIEAKIDQVGVKIDELDTAVGQVRSDLLTGFYDQAAKPLMTDRNVTMDLYESYRVVFRAAAAHVQLDYQGAPDPVGDVSPTTGCWQQSCVANHGYPYSLDFYKAMFVKKYRGSSAQYDNSATEIHDAIVGGGSWGTTPILKQYALSVLLKGKTAYGWRESNALRNFYTSLSEIEALAFTLKAEVQTDLGEYPEAQATLEKFRTFHAQEQRLLPPLLSDGFVVSIPEGVDGPAQIWTTKRWLGATPGTYISSNEIAASLAVQPAVPDSTKMPTSWYFPGPNVISDNYLEVGFKQIMFPPSDAQWVAAQTAVKAAALAAAQGPCSASLVPQPLLAAGYTLDQLCANAGYAFTWMATNPARTGPDANTAPFRAVNVAQSWSDSVYTPIWTFNPGDTNPRCPDQVLVDRLRAAYESTYHVDIRLGLEHPTFDDYFLRVIDVEGLDPIEKVTMGGCASGLVTRTLTTRKGDDYMALGQQMWQAQRFGYAVISADSYGGSEPDNWGECSPDCQFSDVKDPEVTDTRFGRGALAPRKETDRNTYRSVDFGAAPGPTFIDVRASSGLADNANCQVLVSIDGGPRVGIVFIRPTGAWSTFKTYSSPLIATSGVHDVTFEVRGGFGVACVSLSGFQLRTATPPSADPTPAPTPAMTPAPTATPTPTPSAIPAGRDALGRVEAESFDSSNTIAGTTPAITTVAAGKDPLASGGYIGAIANGDWTSYTGVVSTAGKGASFDIRLANGSTVTGSVEVHLNSPTGPIIATATIPNTGGWHTWQTVTATTATTTTSGAKDVFLVFKSAGSGDFVNVDWFGFQ